MRADGSPIGNYGWRQTLSIYCTVETGVIRASSGPPRDLVWHILIHDCSRTMTKLKKKTFLVNALRPGKMAAISPTTFSNAFSWMKMCEFRFRFHWGLFLSSQLTISQYCSDSRFKQTVKWLVKLHSFPKGLFFKIGCLCGVRCRGLTNFLLIMFLHRFYTGYNIWPYKFL